MISLALSTSSSSVATFQHQLRMEYTDHKSHVILGRVYNIMNFMTELSCWYKTTQTRLLFPIRELYGVVMSWLTVTKHPYLTWQWIISFLLRLFPSFLYHDKTFIGRIWETHPGVLTESENSDSQITTMRTQYWAAETSLKKPMMD